MMDDVTVCWVLGLATVAIVVLIGAGPARPVPGVSYSSDGEVWSKDLPESLFEEDIRWVPGDRRSSKLYIMNDTGDDGRLVLWAESKDVEFEKALSVSVDGPNQLTNCAQTVVPARADVLIDISIAMAEQARNDTQKATAGIDLVVQWDNKVDELCSAETGRNSGEGQEGS